MEQNDFHLKWTKDEKFKLMEQLEASFDESVWELVVKQYEEALAAEPDNPEYLFRYGWLMQLKAHRLLRKAAKSYEKGLESKRISSDFDWISGKLHAQLVDARARLLETESRLSTTKTGSGNRRTILKRIAFSLNAI